MHMYIDGLHLLCVYIVVYTYTGKLIDIKVTALPAGGSGSAGKGDYIYIYIYIHIYICVYLYIYMYVCIKIKVSVPNICIYRCIYV